jgi:hypothetical protein
MPDLVDIKPRGHKPPLQILPYAGLVHLAAALEDGMEKYELDNWRAPSPDWAEAYTGAALRHLWALQDRDLPDCADDTGNHHSGNASACLIISLFHSKAAYVQSNNPVVGAGLSPPSLPFFTDANLALGWQPRLDLLPLRPLEAIAGALEDRWFYDAPRTSRDLVSEAIRLLYERQHGHPTAYARAAACCLLMAPEEFEIGPSKNVVAMRFIEAGEPEDEAHTICTAALERMKKVVERRKNDAHLQLQVSEQSSESGACAASDR